MRLVSRWTFPEAFGVLLRGDNAYSSVAIDEGAYRANASRVSIASEPDNDLAFHFAKLLRLRIVLRHQRVLMNLPLRALLGDYEWPLEAEGPFSFELHTDPSETERSPLGRRRGVVELSVTLMLQTNQSAARA